MNPLGESHNLAARAGRWSARHWKTATFGWLALVALVFALGWLVGTKELSDAGGMNGDSARAQRIIDSAGFPDNSYEVVLLESTTVTVRDPAFRRAVQDVVQALSEIRGVEHVQSPYARGNEGQISKSGRSALIAFELGDETNEPYEGVERTLAAVVAVRRAHPNFRVEETGGPSIERALDDTVEKDFRRAEFFSVPLTLGILLVAVGAVFAAFLPVLLALTAFAGATGALAFASQLLPADNAAGSVMLLIGLAVGVDYSLFYLKREREERSLGKGRVAALEAAAATSGRSVLISGLTVIVAMAGMFLAGNATFVGIGLGTIIVVATAVVGSLTVLPAVLSRLGDKVEAGRIPGLGRARAGPESRLWALLLEQVLRRPLIPAVLAGGLLISLAVPALRLHTADPGAGDLPQGIAAVQTLNRIEAAFPGAPDSAVVVVKASDVKSPSVTAAVQRLEERVLTSGAGHEPIDIDVNPGKTVALVSVPLAGSGAGDATSEHALAELRRITSETFDPPEVEAVVGGGIAGSHDFNAGLKSHMPLVFTFVLGLAFLLLLLTFRSLVIAATAITLNMLSIAAAYGLLVVIFQHGFGDSLLGFHSTGAIVSWLPLFLFVVLFGLSMDYHVFILSRMREARDRGLPTDEAISHGIKSTAGVVTAAATVMVFVFAILATLSQLSLKQLGIGLAAAVLIDATLIRGVLLPATMKLLGEWNWYLPRWLSWLPKASAERCRPVSEAA
jgi:putative drug exporter of the RND superfamily